MPGIRHRFTKELLVSYRSDDFPRRVPVSGRLTFDWDDLLWAAITVGRPSRYHVFQHGQSSIYEFLMRLSLVKMAVYGPYVRNSPLVRTDAFINLDPTEKGMITYFLGMATCKLFADRLLGVPWLLHIDVFGAQFATHTLGRSRPDLIGRDKNGRWLGFECKGRSGPPSSRAKGEAKVQAGRIHSVGGAPPVMNVAAHTYFQSSGELGFYWQDPEPDFGSEAPVKIDTSDGEFVARYYRPFADLLELRGEREQPIVSLPEADMKIEFEPELAAALRRYDGLAAADLSSKSSSGAVRQKRSGLERCDLILSQAAS